DMSPPDESNREDALQAWIDDAADRLIHGSDITVTKRFRVIARIEHDAFLSAFQDHLLKRAEEDDQFYLAQLVLAALQGGPVNSLGRFFAGPTDHPLGVPHEIAEGMVESLAEDGYAQQ
ncbi:hypothetical protein, partial [Pseudomonas typographi]|uniref:hypothetical protein n=1 Tax=Pseudomonas typographi TaxID=2715964 RepID=UPI0016866C6F